jgi:hypothetical protein
MSDLSTFFKVVADGYPEIVFKGQKFKVRKTAPDDRQAALDYLQQDVDKALVDIPNADDPMTEDQVALWIKHTASDSQDAVRMFNLDSIKTQRDYRRAVLKISYMRAYMLVMSLMDEFGNPIDRADIFTLAKVIDTQPEFKALIKKTLDKLDIEESTPNDTAQTPS